MKIANAVPIGSVIQDKKEDNEVNELELSSVAESVTSIADSVIKSNQPNVSSPNINESIQSISTSVLQLLQKSNIPESIQSVSDNVSDSLSSVSSNISTLANKSSSVYMGKPVEGYEGWLEQFDNSYNMPYYYNTHTQTSQWEHPKEIIKSVSDSIGKLGTSITLSPPINKPELSIDKSQITNAILTVSRSITDLMNKQSNNQLDELIINDIKGGVL